MTADNEANAATAAAAEGPASVTLADAQDWRGMLDPEQKSLVTAKGWKSPHDVVRSYAHLEKMFGGEKIPLPGKEAKDEDWNAVWDKLGRPNSPDAYQFERPGDRNAYNAEMEDWFRKTAHAAGLTAAQAKKLHAAYLELATANEAEATGGPSNEKVTAAASAAVADIGATLQDIWGSRYKANLAAARRAFHTFMDGEKDFESIADRLGEAPLMQLLARVGSAIGEDSMTGRGGSNLGPRSSADAKRAIERLHAEVKMDPRHPYLNKHHPEHEATVERMRALYESAYGGR